MTDNGKNYLRMANVIDAKLLYDPVAEEKVMHKDIDNISSQKKLDQMNMITKILIWRTASLLKIAAYIYRERISTIEQEEKAHSRRE